MAKFYCVALYCIVLCCVALRRCVLQSDADLGLDVMCPRPISVEEDTPSALLPSTRLSSPHLFSPILYCPHLLLHRTRVTCTSHHLHFTSHAHHLHFTSLALHITCTSLRCVIYHRKSERKMMRTKSTTGEEGKESKVAARAASVACLSSFPYTIWRLLLLLSYLFGHLRPTAGPNPSCCQIALPHHSQCCAVLYITVQCSRI
jgi:hypothetical protein